MSARTRQELNDGRPLEDRVRDLMVECEGLSEDLAIALKEVDRLNALINSPHTTDFLEAVRIEAAHQKERWPAHDRVKDVTDWVWLVAHLSAKTLSPEKTQTPEKLLHHIIATAAVCLNWHAASSGTRS